jgi:hypothetical protein
MPSPFPGMDPYLENPSIWPDFHHSVSGEIRNALNTQLPSPYYARVEMRPEVGIVEEGEESTPRIPIVPDVLVVQHPRLSRHHLAGGGVAVSPEARADVSTGFEVEWLRSASLHHYFVEIRDSNQGHKLITLIEILSPSNKKNGPDRRDYVAKQTEVLRSDANLIEIALLWKGTCVHTHTAMEGFIGGLNTRTDYLISVNRAWKRHEKSIGYLLYPLSVQSGLPCIPVPPREGVREVPLDLRYVFNKAYDSGPYRKGAGDYTQPPNPPLGQMDGDWALGLLRQCGLARSPTS